jgi:hypothetical protein
VVAGGLVTSVTTGNVCRSLEPNLARLEPRRQLFLSFPLDKTCHIHPHVLELLERGRGQNEVMRLAIESLPLVSIHCVITFFTYSLRLKPQI